MSEPEIKQPVYLCDSKGHLNLQSVGWSRHPLHTCNLRGHTGRKKKWNYWCVNDDKRLFSVTLSSVDYLGLAFTYFLEFDTKKFTEQIIAIPFARGCTLSENVNGDITFKNKSIALSFTEDRGNTRIRVDSRAFGGNALSADLLVERPEGHETLNVVIPWSKRRFHFTSKQNCLPAAGTVSIGNETFSFRKENTFACLDFGRGIWHYSSFWNWAFCHGARDGHSVGLNLGAGWTGGTGMTENALCVDGRLNKISEDVLFHYDPSDLMKPWAIKTKSSKRIDILFTPFYERLGRTNALVLKSELHQLFGRFSGTVVADSGESIELENLIGAAEEHRARW
jgi:hypothetical protein